MSNQKKKKERHSPDCQASAVWPLRPPFLLLKKNKYQHFGSTKSFIQNDPLCCYCQKLTSQNTRLKQLSNEINVSLSLSASAAPYDIPTCLQQKLKKITADKVLMLNTPLRRHVEWIFPHHWHQRLFYDSEVLKTPSMSYYYKILVV